MLKYVVEYFDTMRDGSCKDGGCPKGKITRDDICKQGKVEHVFIPNKILTRKSDWTHLREARSCKMETRRALTQPSRSSAGHKRNLTNLSRKTPSAMTRSMSACLTTNLSRVRKDLVCKFLTRVCARLFDRSGRLSHLSSKRLQRVFSQMTVVAVRSVEVQPVPEAAINGLQMKKRNETKFSEKKRRSNKKTAGTL